MSQALDEIIKFVRDPHPQHLKRLVLWQDPKWSAAVLASGSLGLLALHHTWHNLPLYVSYLAGFFIVASFAYQNAAPLAKVPNLPSPKWLEGGITEEDVLPYVRKAINVVINPMLGVAHHLFTGQHFKLSGAALAASWVASKVFRSVSLLTLLLAALVLVFSVPIAYDKNRKEVDQALKRAREQAEASLGPHIKKLADLAKRAPAAPGTAPAPAASSTNDKKREKKRE